MEMPKEFAGIFRGADLTEDEIRTLNWITGWEHQTVENLRSAVQKAQGAALTPPNEPLPVLVNDEPDREYIDYICPRCKNTISQRRRGQRMETVYKCKFHDNCGQRVDWSNPQPYRRPPEGEA